MHDCHNTKREILDALFDEIGASEKARLAAELQICPACRSEYAAVQTVFGEYERFAAADAPSEDYWQTYENDLRRAILSADGVAVPQSLWRKIFQTSVRVPVPVAAAFAVLFIAALSFAVRVPKIETIEVAAPPVVSEKTVEKVVVREKQAERVVTRTVFVPRREKASKNVFANSIVTRRKQTPKASVSPMPTLNLAEFEPPRKVEFKIIKTGGANDEK